MSHYPDPLTEIRMTTLHAIRGANYWSRDPVIRMDLAIGEYEQIASDQAPWLTDQLVATLPGLEEHRCSVGTPGGFITRLRRGTYAAHIVEHVAIELQEMIEQHVTFGRTRGTGTVGEYTLVFEYAHEGVGLRAAALALQIVQQAFAGTLERESVAYAVAELQAMTRTPNPPPLRRRICCGITGSDGRDLTREALLALGLGNDSSDTPLVDVAPAYIVQAGLPYSHSDLAIILDTTPTDVSEWYRDSERAARLMSVVAEAVTPAGCVVCPDNAHELHAVLHNKECRIAPFAHASDRTKRARRAAEVAAACLAQGATPRVTSLNEQ